MRALIATVLITLFVFRPVTCTAETPKPEPEAKNNECISVDFPDAEIGQVLRDVAGICKIRATLPESLTGRTSIKLRNVTWRQIFQVTLQPIDYTFIEYEDHVQVLTIKDAEALPLVSKEVELYFQKPAEVVAYLQRRFNSKVTVTAGTTSIRILVHPRFAWETFKCIEEADKPETRLLRFPRKPFFPQTILLKGEKLPEIRSGGRLDFTSITINEKNVLTTTSDILPITTEVFIIDWIDCDEIKAFLEKLLPKTAKVIADIRSNALVISGDTETLQRAKTIIEYLDDKRWYDPTSRDKR